MKSVSLKTIALFQDGQMSESDRRGVLDALQFAVVDCEGNILSGDVSFYLSFPFELKVFFLPIVFLDSSNVSKEVGSSVLSWMYTPKKPGNYTLTVKQEVMKVVGWKEHISKEFYR